MAIVRTYRLILSKLYLSAWARALALIVAAPLLWISAAGAAYVWNSREHDREAVRAFADDLNPPTPAQRYLIVAPHPDDEVLGCGGLMHYASRVGAGVRVLYMTNGDAFRFAAERETRRLRVDPMDYIRLGVMRRREAETALSTLGLPPKSFRMLGFPDGGLEALFHTNWSEARRYRSPTTALDAVPVAYEGATGAPYCGAALLRLLEDEIRSYAPTDILCPHPSDDHRDHSATGAFVEMALASLSIRGGLPPNGCRLRHYIIHRGSWPQPQGPHLADRMAPPSELIGLHTGWRGLSISKDATETKAAAIRAFRSQMAIMSRFLLSFARRNEVFGTPYPYPPASVSTGAVVQQPVRDNLVRRFRPQADIKSVRVEQLQGGTLVAVQTERPAGRFTELLLNIRWLDRSGGAAEGDSLAATITGDRVEADRALDVRQVGDQMHITIPSQSLRAAGFVVVEAETRMAGVMVDRSGPVAVWFGG